MEPGPTYEFWWRFAAILFVEVAAIAVAAWGLEKLSTAGAWRRIAWHVCLIGLAALVAAETTGLGRIVAARFALQAQPVQSAFQPSETFSFPAERFSASEEPIAILTSPASNTVVAPRPSWWPATLWFAGFAFVSLGAVFLRVLFAFVSRRRFKPASEGIVERARQVAALLGVRRRVDVVEVNGITAPVAFGIVKAKIGVPGEFSQKFTQQQQEVMLAHELAHVAGRDALWHLLADLVAALLWWHPMVWWARRRLRFATEAAADEASMVVKDGPRILAETLVGLGRGLVQQHRGALGIRGFRSGLACRVQKLMTLKDGEWRGLSVRDRWLLKLCGPFLLVAGTIACFAWTGSPGGTPREEWQNSVAGRTFAALSAVAGADVERIPGLLGDAKIFFEAGKLDHAEGLCEEVLRSDSENSAALRLIDAISKKRNSGENIDDESGARPAGMERVLPPEVDPSKNRFISPQTIGSFEHVISNALNFPTEETRRRVRFTEGFTEGSGVSNIVYHSKGRQRIRRLLEEIRLPSVIYDNVSLGAVLHRLSDEARQLDPEKRGIDFIFPAEKLFHPSILRPGFRLVELNLSWN